MMSKPIFWFGLILAILLGPRVLAASDPYVESLLEGTRLMKAGRWDASEISYLKASHSPEVDHRVEAYRGLTNLYRKVRLSRKAGRAEVRAREEASFQRTLVPRDPKAYRAYKVRKADTYSGIAARHRVSQEWLQRANGSRMLRVGDVIRLPALNDFIVVEKSSKTLYWLRGKQTVKKYPVSIGRKGFETPDGEFLIEEKIERPSWTWNKQIFPAGHPKNLLGSRWMGLNKKGYGIHGTRFGGTIGAPVSHGCIRLRNEDVEELFMWIPRHTKVFVCERWKSRS
jgi:lipoprotein-anchoring transpeptidase ErfK/SrfK